MSVVAQRAFTEPSPSDWQRWEERLLNGEEPKVAAEAVGQSCSSFRRQDEARQKRLLQAGREARAHVADAVVEDHVVDVDEDGVPRSFKADTSDAMKLAWAKRWQPEFAGTQKVDVEVGGTLDINSPDVAQAIERFTAGVVQLANRQRTSLAPGDPPA